MRQMSEVMQGATRQSCRRSSKIPSRPVIAFGPEMPEWGSWDWVGADTMRELAGHFVTFSYAWGEIPACDVVFVIKHAPALQLAARTPGNVPIVYCPVDFFGSPEHIACEAAWLRRCSRIVIHCERLRKYFEPYARVEYIDHCVKFVTPHLVKYRPEGYVLWVGVWTNLPPVVQWVNRHPLPYELKVLTNLGNANSCPTASELGFRSDLEVSIETWSRERHREAMSRAKAALDIKAADFRSSHKPPAKAIDFVASGVPVAMNCQSSALEHLARMGFDMACPCDTQRWLSREYWTETRRFGRALRELLDGRRIGSRYKYLVERVLAERNH